jgi:hypothetical protein
MIEYIIWGVPPGGEMEDLLCTEARTREEAEWIAETLRHSHGCTGVRIQEFDPSVPPDFGNVLNI